MLTRYLTLALALGTLTTPLAAQRMAGPDSARFASPIATMLEHRQELALTDEQVTRLEQIDRELAEKNRAAREKLQALRADSGFAGKSRREKMAAARPAMEEMRSNREAAMERVQDVLTEEQRSQARELVRAEREKMRGRRGEQRRPRRDG